MYGLLQADLPRRMDQVSEVERLRALLEESEREKRELRAKLNQVESHSLTTATSHTSYINHGLPSPSHPILSSRASPASSTVPYRAPDNHLASQLDHVQQEQSRPMKRSKTTHTAASSATAPMMRSRSNLSRPGTNLHPFVAKGSAPIALPPSHGGQASAYVDQGQFREAASIPILDDLLPNGELPHGGLGREMGVEEFLSMSDEALFPVTAPINIPPSVLLAQGPERYLDSNIPSVCGSMTSGTTLDTASMSRQNSALVDNASISGQFSQMVRIQSQQSMRGNVRQDSLHLSPTAACPPLLGKRSSEDAGEMRARDNSFAFAHPSSAPTPSVLSEHCHPMETSLSQSSVMSTSSAGQSRHELGGPFLAQHLNMERSISKDSVRSNTSLKLRAKEALCRQNLAAKSRHLQPKPAAGPAAKPEPADSTSGSSAKDGKAVIAKTKYERPKHPKVMCNQCNEHPDGFRGEHELRRHTEAKHKSMVKRWVCRDPALYGIPHSETAVKALKDCRHCSQNKQYGAYYNAAAHLRRTHFKVKPRKGAAGAAGGRSKNGQGDAADEEQEKRGGKGGGDWPPMSELKHWMVEVTVPLDQSAGAQLAPAGTESVGAGDAEAEAEDEEDEEDEFGDSQYGSQEPAAAAAAAAAVADMSMPMGSDGFGMAAFAGVGGGFGQTLDDLTGMSFPQGAELVDPQLSQLYHPHPHHHHLLDGSLLPPSGAAMQAAAPVPSTAGFGSKQADLLHLQQGAASSSLMSIDGHGHGYASPVPSTTTLTHAGAGALLGGNHLLLRHAAAGQASADDLADLPFDLTFNAVGP